MAKTKVAKTKVAKTKVAKTKVAKIKSAKAKKSVKKPAPQAASARKSAVPAVKKTAKPVAKKAAKKAAQPKPKNAKVIKLPVKKGAKSAPAKASQLKLVVDHKKKSDWAKILTPLDDRILVQIDETRERVTAGGLIIPDTAEVEGNHRGLVVSVGPGHRGKKGHFRPLELKVGDQVLFGQYSGTEIELEKQKFKILRETDVLGLVTK